MEDIEDSLVACPCGCGWGMALPIEYFDSEGRAVVRLRTEFEKAQYRNKLLLDHSQETRSDVRNADIFS
jgi:hypothetical protein